MKNARKTLQPEMLYTYRQGRLFNLRTITPFSATREFINGQPSHDENYVATFQQHLHMEYISLNWYDIPELVVPIEISVIESSC
jgi:hypothetical protein